MITLYFAPHGLQLLLSQVKGERELIKVVSQEIENYQFATQIDSNELDLAYAAAGGPSPWTLADNLPALSPTPSRKATFGDILVETDTGYVNLATPAGFIPLVDSECHLGILRKKQFN